jgi:hypothetical protein
MTSKATAIIRVFIKFDGSYCIIGFVEVFPPTFLMSLSEIF